MTFSVVEGETDLPFLPDGAGTPFGQGLRGTKGLTAVLAGARPDSVLCRNLAGVSSEPVSSLEVFAKCFEGRRSSWRVRIQVNTKYERCAHIPQEFRKDGTGLPSLDLGKVVWLAEGNCVFHMSPNFAISLIALCMYPSTDRWHQTEQLRSIWKCTPLL